MICVISLLPRKHVKQQELIFSRIKATEQERKGVCAVLKTYIIWGFLLAGALYNPFTVLVVIRGEFRQFRK